MTAISASRGQDIREYIPALAKGAVIPLSCISAGFTTGVTAGGILSAHLGTGSVTTVKIATGAVTSAKIGAAAVTSARIGTAAVTNAKMKAAFLSGTLVSGRTTRSIAHGMGVKPKFVIVNALPTLAQANSASKIEINLAAASAATSAVFYVIGSQPANGALKYVAYVQI